MNIFKISRYTIIYPLDSTKANLTAALELQKYLKHICGTELLIFPDNTAQTEFEILVGFTNRSTPEQFNIEKLGDEGFVIEAVGKKIFIAGSGVRGAIYGVYTFLENFMGCAFYSADCEKIPHCAEFDLSKINRTEEIPIFEYREIDFVSSRKNGFQIKLKANGKYSPNDDTTGGRVDYSGGFVHTLCNIISEDKYFETHPEYFALKEDGTRQKGWGAQLCLTNPDVYRIVKEHVENILRETPNARIISISQSDSENDTPPCMCEKCKKVHEQEGAFSGSIIRFVNAIAKEFKDKYPNLKFDTLAYKYSRNICKTAPINNVIVRLCSIECCFSHSLGSCNDVYAVVGNKKSFAEDISDWGKVCNNIYIWDYTTNYKESVIFFPNFSTLLKNAKFFADNNVKGLYEEGNFFSETCDFPELRSYIMGKILWDPYMSEEKYNRYIDDFLHGFYGEGYHFIREYIDLAQSIAKNHHFGIYEEFTKNIFSHTIENVTDKSLLSDLNIKNIENYQNTDWSKFIDYKSRIKENILTEKGKILFESALSLATQEQSERIEKAMLQIDFLRSYALYDKYNEDRITNNIKDLLKDFYINAKIEFDESFILEVCKYVSNTYKKVYEDFNEKLYKKARKFDIKKLGEVSKNITDANVVLGNTPYNWK